MSLWKFGDFETDVDFTDADFLDAIEDAKAAMYEEQKNVPVVGKNSDIIRAQCACFYVFFDTLFGEGAGERILRGKTALCCATRQQSRFWHLKMQKQKHLKANMVSTNRTGTRHSSSRSPTRTGTASREDLSRERTRIIIAITR